MSSSRRKIDLKASSAQVSPGTLAVRNRLREMLADALRKRASWVAIGSLALALVLTFVLAPLLSLLLAGLAGAAVQAVLSRFGAKPSGLSGGTVLQAGRLGGLPAVNLRARRHGGDLFHLFCLVSAFALLTLGSMLTLAAHDISATLLQMGAFGGLSAMLSRR